MFLFTLILGTYSVYKYNKLTDKHDNSEIIIDEFIAQLMPFFFIEFNFINVLFIFIVFRFFDIIKIWPCNIIDNKMTNYVGVMLDDIIAAIQTIVLYILIKLIFKL